MIVKQDITSSNWTTVKLGDICKTTSGGTPNRSESRYYNGNILWVKSGELDNGLITDTEEKITEAGLQNSSAKIFPKGTLLIALYGATIGKLAFLGAEAATNQAICGIYENENLESKYLFYFLTFRKKELVKQAIGGAQPNISQGILRNLQISIPPKEIQKAIVSKIEELFSELDKGMESLRIAQQQLKTYRQSVLKWAFEGRLTNEITKDGKLPEGWNWVKLADVSQSCLGKMLDKQKNKGTPKPYLRNINVRWNDFNLDDLLFMPFEANEDERYGIKNGDLIICEGGEPGRAAIWKNQLPEMKIQKALHRVRFDNSANPKYFMYYLRFISQTKHIEQYFTGTTIKHLTGQSLKKISYPFPYVEEQSEIVQRIESRFSLVEKLEETIIQSLQQAETLRQSILKKAFEGKLV